MERILLIGSKEGDTILDPFMGSGTSGVVAKRLSRNFVGIEIDDRYFEWAEKRIASMNEQSQMLIFPVEEEIKKPSQLEFYANE